MSNKPTLIDYWSYSSMSSFLRNPLAFKKKYILKIYDDLYSPSSIVGTAGHKALEAYYNGRTLEEAKDIGLDYINNQSDTGINYGKTGTREQIINNYNQAINFYFEELPTYHKILGVEFDIVAPIETVDGKKLSLPAKSKSDLIVENALGEIEIIDHKFVKSYADGDVDDFSKFLQAMFMYHTVKWKFGKAPARIVFNECKISKNRNGEPQIQPYTIEFSQMHDFATFYKLYDAASQNVNLEGFAFLPNPNDIFDGQISFEVFRSGVIGIDAPVSVKHKEEQIAFAEKNYVPSAHDSVANDFSPEGKIKAKFSEFGIGTKIEETHVGPSVTQYTFKPSKGVRMSKVASLTDDIAIALSAPSVRVDAPIFGTSLIGVEVPNEVRTTVPLTDNHFKPGTTQLPIGVDVYGKTHYKDLAEMPHLLIAGATGAGKSVMLNVILHSLTAQNEADTLKLVLIDPKQVELTQFEKLPHLMMPVVTNSFDACHTLHKMTEEMETRYKALRRRNCRTIDEFNAKKGEKMSKIVIVVDEFADLMMNDIAPSAASMDIKAFNENLEHFISIGNGRITQKATKAALKQTIEQTSPPSAENSIVRIAQKARAVGMHLIIATQRPSADVVTGLIKANIPTKIAFMTTNAINSKIILDETGAEKLTGKGDMLFLDPAASSVKRLQGLYK